MSNPSDELTIPEDFFNLGVGIPKMGLIYYDEMTGDIRGLSFVADEALAIYPSIPAEEETILRLMNEPALVDWAVDVVDDEMRLVNVNESNVALDLTEDEAVVLLKSDDRKTAPVSLHVKVSKTGGYVGFQLTAASKRMALRVARNQDLYFVITKRGDPEAILGVFNISLSDLATRATITRRLSREARAVDIYTRRCSPLGYFIDEVENLRPVFDLPAVAFEDVVEFEKAQLGDGLEPALIVMREDDDLVFRLHHGGGPIYDRAIGELTVMLTAPRDKHHLLGLVSILVCELEKGDVRVPIPENVVDREFDICGQLLYHSLYDVRTPSN